MSLESFLETTILYYSLLILNIGNPYMEVKHDILRFKAIMFVTHTLIHTYTHKHIHSYTHTHIHSYTHTHIHTYTHTNIHTYTHTHIHTHFIKSLKNGLDKLKQFVMATKQIPKTFLQKKLHLYILHCKGYHTRTLHSTHIHHVFANSFFKTDSLKMHINLASGPN